MPAVPTPSPLWERAGVRGFVSRATGPLTLTLSQRERGKKGSVGCRQRLGSGIHFGQERIPPCHPLGEDLFDGTGLIIAGVSAQRVTALLDRLDCLQEQAPGRNDGAVGWPQVLPRAVHDWPHAFL